MKNSSLIIAILVFLFLGSCIPSLFPLYFEKDLITNDNLVGSWKDNDSKDIWVFNQQIYKNEKRKSYTLRYLEKSNNIKDDGRPGVLGVFDIHLFNLGDNSFIDFYPGENKEMDNEINTLMALHLIPAHTFAKVEISKDTIKIFQFDVEHLEDLLEDGKIRIKHVKTDDNIILTATTKELQEFFIKYAEDEDAYTDPIILVKDN